MLELIILDVFGTIVPIDAISDKGRAGLSEFLEFYRKRKTPVVVFSDIPRQAVEQTLMEVGLVGKFRRVYGKEDMALAGSVQDASPVKDLGRVCNDFRVNPANAVFIGDNFVGRDARSAEAFGIRFIKVPQYRVTPPSLGYKDYHREWVDFEDPTTPFSFKSLIGKL